MFCFRIISHHTRLRNSPLFKQLVDSSQRHFGTHAVLLRSAKVNLFDLNFDRRIKVDYQDSIKYMDSEAYKKTYDGNMIWKLYRRNGKSAILTDRTRPNCVSQEGFISTSYPCPICRDEYLILHPENIKLLEQFMNPYTGKILTPKHHGLCLKQYRNLVISIHQARDLGYLTYEIPDRLYDYQEYYSQ